MKIYLCIVGIFYALALVECETTSEMKKLFDDCAKDVGLSEDSFKGSHRSTKDDDSKVECFGACVMEKKGYMVDNNVVIEKAIEFAAKHFPKDITETDIIECSSKANEEKDKCNVARALDKCLLEKHSRPKE